MQLFVWVYIWFDYIFIFFNCVICSWAINCRVCSRCIPCLKGHWPVTGPRQTSKTAKTRVVRIGSIRRWVRGKAPQRRILKRWPRNWRKRRATFNGSEHSLEKGITVEVLEAASSGRRFWVSIIHVLDLIMLDIVLSGAEASRKNSKQKTRQCYFVFLERHEEARAADRRYEICFSCLGSNQMFGRV